MPAARAELVDRLAAAVRRIAGSGTLRVGVDGPDAAGKTTLVRELAAMLTAAGSPVLTVSLDGFYHPRARRRRRGALSPEGYYDDAFDYPAFRRDVLDPLRPGGTGRIRPASHDVESDALLHPPPVDVQPGTVLLVDGVFLQRPELADAWDAVVYLHGGPAETLRRVMRRDVGVPGDADALRERYEQRYLPAQEHYRRVVDPVARAWAVIDNEDPARPSWLRTPRQLWT